MDSDYNNNSTDNEFDQCYPNRLNQGIPSYASREMPRYYSNKPAQFAGHPQYNHPQRYQSNLLEQSPYDRRTPEVEKKSFNEKKPAMKTQKFDEVRKYLDRSGLAEPSHEGYYRDPNSSKINARDNAQIQPKANYYEQANYGDRKKLYEAPRQNVQQNLALQKKMEENRYTAINKLLEARRQALEGEDSEEYGSQNEDRYEARRQYEEESYEYENNEELEDEGHEYGEEYLQGRNEQYDYNDEEEQEQSYDEEEYAEEDEDLTYEQIIREDAIPVRDERRGYQATQSPQNYPQYPSNKSYGNPAIFSTQPPNDQRRGSDMKKPIQLKTLQSDYLNDQATDTNSYAKNRRNKNENNENDAESLRRVYTQLQADFARKQHERPQRDNFPPKNAPTLQNRRESNEDRSYQERFNARTNASPAFVEEVIRKEYSRQNEPTPRVNRWAKPESVKKNENYDMGHQVQRVGEGYRNQQSQEEEEVLESYRYQGKQTQPTKYANPQNNNMKPNREERYVEREYTDKSFQQQKNQNMVSGRPSAKPRLNNEMDHYEGDLNPSQFRERNYNNPNSGYSPHKAPSHHKENSFRKLSDNEGYKNQPNSRTNTWVDPNMPFDHPSQNRFSPSPMNQSSIKRHPTQGNQEAIQPEGRPKNYAKHQTPTLSQNSSFYQVPQTLSSSPISNVPSQSNLREARPQYPQLGTVVPMQPQLSVPTSTQNQYQAPIQVPVNSNFQSAAGYPPPIQQFQSNSIISPQYPLAVNPQISSHTAYASNNYIMPPPMNINPTGQAINVYPPQGQVMHSGPLPVYYGSTPMLPSQPLVTEGGYAYYPDYRALSAQQNLPAHFGYGSQGQPMIINTSQTNPMANPYIGTTVTTQGGKEEDPGSQKRGSFDHTIKNYIKDQEEFLQKLENDKKQLAERLKQQSLQQARAEEKSGTGIGLYKSQETKNERSYEEQIKASPANTKKPDFPKEIIQVSPPRTKLAADQNAQQKQVIENLGVDQRIPSDIAERDFNRENVKSSPWKASRNQQFTDKREEQGSNIITNTRQPDARVKDATKMEVSGAQRGPLTQNFMPKQMEIKKSNSNFEEQGKENQVIVVGEEGPSLAERFLQNKKKLVERYNEKKEHTVIEHREARPPRTKEEMLQQRKAMMEYKGSAIGRSRSEMNINRIDNSHGTRSKSPIRFDHQKMDPHDHHFEGRKEPNPELLERLALGTKAKVSKKEMINLTNKNYEMLPEVKKKKEEQRKKEETKKRLEKVKELNQKVRGNLQCKALKHNESVF